MRYPVLYVIVFIHYFIGGLCLLAGGSSLVIFLSGNTPYPGVGLVSILIAIAMAVPAFAVAELLRLLINIEDNTRPKNEEKAVKPLLEWKEEKRPSA